MPPRQAVLFPALVGTGLFKLALLSFPVSYLVTGASAEVWVLGTTVLVVTVVCQVVVVRGVLTGRQRERAASLAAVVELASSLVPLVLLGPSWSALPTLGLADVMLCLDGVLRAVFAVGSAVVVGVMVGREYAGQELLLQLAETGLAVMIFYWVLRMGAFIRELEDTRAELARLAVGSERLRVARDLHDTLGHTLSVGLLKLEVAERVRDVDAAAGRRELTEVSSLLRDAIGSMQQVVAGIREQRLQTEVETASSVLRSAGIDTDTRVDELELGRSVDEALSWVVREGTTNVLRHSHATRCSIELTRCAETVVLRLVNDLPGEQRRRSGPSGGHGLEGLRQRLTEIGGTLASETGQDEFRLVATVGVPSRR